MVELGIEESVGGRGIKVGYEKSTGLTLAHNESVGEPVREDVGDNVGEALGEPIGGGGGSW
jgi:hypothetical protein